MSKFTNAIKATLKSYFEAGDQPTEAQFAEWIDAIQAGIQEHQHKSTGGQGSGTGDAARVNWADLLDKPATLVNWAQVITVAQSGGDYTSLGAAMAAISPSSSNPYCILLMPGWYDESAYAPLTVKSYCSIIGLGGGYIDYMNTVANAGLRLSSHSAVINLVIYDEGNDLLTIPAAQKALVRHCRIKTDSSMPLFVKATGDCAKTVIEDSWLSDSSWGAAETINVGTNCTGLTIQRCTIWAAGDNTVVLQSGATVAIYHCALNKSIGGAGANLIATPYNVIDTDVPMWGN